MKKLLMWLPAVLATVLGLLEAVIKFIKEVLTLAVDILFPVIPSPKFKLVVTWLRAKVDVVYDLLSKAKDAILKWLALN